MSNTLERSTFYRLMNTPLSHLLCGRITGPVMSKAKVRPIALQPEARALVDRIVRRTRLWKSEKIEVDQELSAHFADGQDAGESVQELIRAFGDEATAARLIRKAKKRNRPWPWQMMRRLMDAASLLIVGTAVLYVVLAALFFTGHPAPSVDYAARADRAFADAPTSDRGWPLYRQALLAMGEQTNAAKLERWKLFQAHFEGSPRWPELKSWLTQNRHVVAMLCDASSKPIFGFRYARDGWPSDLALWPEPPQYLSGPARGLKHLRSPVEHEFLYGIYNILIADAKAAADDRDPTRWNRDISAMLNLWRQMQNDPVMDILKVLAYTMAVDETERLLISSPDLLSDDAWIKLAHRLSAGQTAADFLSYKPAQLQFYDDLQRMFTDDGAGNGRMTPEGIRYYLDDCRRFGSQVGETGRNAPAWVGPVSLLMTSSRQRLTSDFNATFDAMESELHRPIREIDAALTLERNLAWKKRSNGLMNFVPLYPMLLIAGNNWPNPLHDMGERKIGRRDGVVVGIALELHHRHHGAYPDSLSQLVPDLLPAVPVDRINGKPVCYRLIGGRPIVYSVGADRDDDGGRCVTDRNGIPNPWAAAQWGETAGKTVDGDWALYPELRDKNEGNED